ncbi:MAG: Clp1/GlmU family protein, partial [Thiohalorhabdaceae bacterium]
TGPLQPNAGGLHREGNVLERRIMTDFYTRLSASVLPAETRLAVPHSWDRALTDLVRQPPSRVVVLGATDRGKSTFCALLRHRLLASGTSTALVDADVGQKDLGHPATISRGLATPRTAPAQQLTGHYFVGAISPPGHLLPIAIGARRLAEADGAQVTLVDTPGMIQGAGRILLQFMLESLRPEAVVALERNGEAGALLAGAQACCQFRLPPPPTIAAKTADQRRANRARGFREHFVGASRQHWPLDRLGIQRSLLFSGVPVPSGPHVHAEDTPEGRLVVGGPDTGEPGVRHLPADFSGRYLEVITAVPSAQAAILQLGDLYVRPDGYEQAGRRPRNL